MTFRIHLWFMIPCLMLYSLVLFGFKNYTIQEYFLGNGIIAFGIGLIYFGEGIYNKFRGKK